MQRVPENLLLEGVAYRVHKDGTARSRDLLGTLNQTNIFSDGDVRYLFHHLVVPVESWMERAHRSHVRELSTWLRSINPDTHTFYVTAQNMWVQRIIAAKTGKLIQSPLLTHYFG